MPHRPPWSETTLKLESFAILTQLAALNRTGFLTINSQPLVNGVSSHPDFGWGGLGRYVYQKGYCECFLSPENAQRLMEIVKAQTSLNLYAVNNHSEEIQSGIDSEGGGATALTWGVFPNREIIQPTIFDPDTFLIWAEEVFSLWTSMWLNLYEFGSESCDLIENTRDDYYVLILVSSKVNHD